MSKSDLSSSGELEIQRLVVAKSSGGIHLKDQRDTMERRMGRSESSCTIRRASFRRAPGVGAVGHRSGKGGKDIRGGECVSPAQQDEQQNHLEDACKLRNR